MGSDTSNALLIIKFWNPKVTYFHELEHIQNYLYNNEHDSFDFLKEKLVVLEPINWLQ